MMTVRENPPYAKASATVLRAGPGDLFVLSQVIADAFHGLPPSHWLVADPDARRRIFPGYFQLFVEHALATGLVLTTPDRSAAALWIPVRKTPEGPSADYATRLAAITDPWTDRFRAFDAVLDSHHPSAFPHHHLAMLAVRPDRQGRGIGTTMLRAHHALLDEEGIPAYLEAANQRTRVMYLRHGYTDHGAPIQLPGGPFMFPMWRSASMEG
jgi:GNAT superfamily N-acetyltransferase